MYNFAFGLLLVLYFEKKNEIEKNTQEGLTYGRGDKKKIGCKDVEWLVSVTLCKGSRVTYF